MCSMIVCVLIPRFALLAALGGDRESLLRPVALAPEPGRAQTVGEVSGPAEAFGIRPGMALAEALARCPELVLVAPDADRTESAWEELLRRLEELGAAVESGGSGEAFFEADGIKALWGGHIESLAARIRRLLGVPARIGAAPTRFAAYAAAARARRRAGRGRVEIVPPGAVRAFLAPLPVSLLHARLEDDVSPALERLGIRDRKSVV